jgi:PAS domain-containing protein
LSTSVGAVTVAAADLLAAVPVGAAILDSDLRFAFVNQARGDLDGVPVADHVGRSVADVLPGLVDDLVPILERVLRTGCVLTDVGLETGLLPGPTRPASNLADLLRSPAVRVGPNRGARDLRGGHDRPARHRSSARQAGVPYGAAR